MAVTPSNIIAGFRAKDNYTFDTSTIPDKAFIRNSNDVMNSPGQTGIPNKRTKRFKKKPRMHDAVTELGECASSINDYGISVVSLSPETENKTYFTA